MGLEVEVVAETNKFDVIIIGGGVAGITCGCILTQLKIKTCFLEKNIPGGKLIYINKITNSKITNNEISGKNLALSIFNKAVDEIKTKYIYGEVNNIWQKNNKFYLYTKDGQVWEAKSVVVASGSQYKKLNVDNEEKFFGKGLSYCVMYDAILTKNKSVVLISNDNSSSDLIKQYCEELTILKPNDVKSFCGNETLQGVMTKDNNLIQCDYAFINIGLKYDNNFLPYEIARTNNNEIIVDKNMSTNIHGIFACGDCTNSNIVTIEQAISSATIAANSVNDYLNEKNKK